MRQQAAGMHMAGANTRMIFEKIKETTYETYDVRFASAVCVFLSLTLCWIPVLGPAVAGYVAGRKSGSMVKGFFIGLIVGTVIISVVWLMAGLVFGPGGYPGVSPVKAADNLSGIWGAFAHYMSSFYRGDAMIPDLSNIGVLALFGMVGGLLSKQIQKETTLLLSTGAMEGHVRKMPRSMELYTEGRKVGFETFDDCMMNQNISVNQNPESRKSEPVKAPIKTKDRTASSTVQTVTTMISSTTDNDLNISDVQDGSDARRQGRAK